MMLKRILEVFKGNTDGIDAGIRDEMRRYGVDIPKGAFDVSVLEMDSGQLELGWRQKDADGRTEIHQRALSDRETAQRLLDLGFPKVRVEGRIGI